MAFSFSVLASVCLYCNVCLQIGKCRVHGYTVYTSHMIPRLLSHKRVHVAWRALSFGSKPWSHWICRAFRKLQFCFSQVYHWAGHLTYCDSEWITLTQSLSRSDSKTIYVWILTIIHPESGFPFERTLSISTNGSLSAGWKFHLLVYGLSQVTLAKRSYLAYMLIYISYSCHDFFSICNGRQ